MVEEERRRYVVVVKAMVVGLRSKRRKR